MDQPSPSPPSHHAAATVRARAEEVIAQAGEKILNQRLHQVLDEGGSSALLSLSDSLLPLLQALILVLPRAISEGPSPSVLSAAQTLGAALQERGTALPTVLAEALSVHDHLLREIGGGLRAQDSPLFTAFQEINRALLEIGREALLAYQEGADASLAHVALTDPTTGLSSWHYYHERTADQLQLVRRTERPLALMLLVPTRASAPPGKDPLEATGHIASLLRSHTRRADLAARREDDVFALLLPDTGRDGALVLLDRLRRSALAQERPLQFRAGTAVAPDEGLSVEALVEQAEYALAHA